jgi:hypothetical protein
MVHVATVTVVVEVVTTVAWMISLDRSMPGRLVYRVGYAWREPRNRAAFIAAGRQLMTEQERQATRAAYGLPPEPLDEPQQVADALPDDTTGERSARTP